MIRTWHQPTPIVALLAACTCLYLASPAKGGECGDPCTVTAAVPDIHLVDTTSASTSDDWEIRTEAGLLRMGQLAGNQQLFTLDISAPTNTLHVDGLGRVGINTTVPAEELQINGTFPKIRLDAISAGAGLADLSVKGNTFFLEGNTGERIVRVDTRAPSSSIAIADNGRIGLGNPVPSARLHVAGDARVEGDVALGSSRTVKTAFDAVDPSEILATLADLPVASWRYKTEDEAERHIGPFAEDFQRLFGLGDGETISVIDAQGVAFAAIQGLAERNSALERELARKGAEMELLRTERVALAARLDAIEKHLASKSKEGDER